MAPSSPTTAAPTTPCFSAMSALIAAATAGILRSLDAISPALFGLEPSPARTPAARPLRSTMNSSTKRRCFSVSSAAHRGGLWLERVCVCPWTCALSRMCGPLPEVPEPRRPPELRIYFTASLVGLWAFRFISSMSLPMQAAFSASGCACSAAQPVLGGQPHNLPTSAQPTHLPLGPRKPGPPCVPHVA
jgi:hypothetical protein